MKLNYHPDTDSLHIDLSEQVSTDTNEISEGVLLDYDAEGNLVGTRACKRARNADGNSAPTRSSPPPRKRGSSVRHFRPLIRR